MSQITPHTIQFLKDLSQNNDREWYNTHKKAAQQARTDWATFVDGVIDRLRDKAELGSVQAKQCVFRLQRDVRFSKDKTPYNPHFSAYITAQGKKTPKAGLFFRIKPDGSSLLGGGLWHGDGPTLAAIRQEIDYCGDEWHAILNAAGFKKRYGTIEGEQLKRPPKGYTADHPNIDHLRHKQWLASIEITESQYTSATFAHYIEESYDDLKPFLDFLNRVFD